MSMLLNLVKSFARNEEGQDLLEYAARGVDRVDRDRRGGRGRQQRSDDLQQHRDAAGEPVLSDEEILGPARSRAGPTFRRAGGDGPCQKGIGPKLCSHPLPFWRSGGSR